MSTKNTDFKNIERTAKNREKTWKIITYVLLTFWALIVLFPFSSSLCVMTSIVFGELGLLWARMER